MTLSCFCAFRIGDYFQWSDLWALVGAGIGAYLGFLAASQIYKRERKDKAEEERRLERHLFDTAKLLIENASTGGRKAESSFRDLLKQYEEYPYGLHKRHINLNTPLITLDRMDRERLLRSYKVILGEEKGLEMWRETWRFCDGLTAQTKLCKEGVLSGQQDLHGCSERMGGYCRELFLLASLLRTELSDQPSGVALAQSLSSILVPVQQMGFVLVDEMYMRLVEPIGKLFNTGVLSISYAYQLADVLSQARSAYQRYGAIVDELKINLSDYAIGCGKIAKDGEDLLDRMNAELPKPQ